MFQYSKHEFITLVNILFLRSEEQTLTAKICRHFSRERKMTNNTWKLHFLMTC